MLKKTIGISYKDISTTSVTIGHIPKAKQSTAQERFLILLLEDVTLLDLNDTVFPGGKLQVLVIDSVKRWCIWINLSSIHRMRC